MAPAITASRNGRLVAVASRDPERATTFAHKHAIPKVGADYEALLGDTAVDAVYIPLVNSLHREWALRAFAAGKHVLCEKPLAMNAGEAEEMARAATASGMHLMEAFMYRFKPRTREFVERVRTSGAPGHVEARFGFPLDHPGDYRLVPELGGGALLDVGCYVVNVSRWLLGEPVVPVAEAHIDPATGVDMTTSARLRFPGGGTASVWCSFESPEDQMLMAETQHGKQTLLNPFGGRNEPEDPYQLMVESFGDSIASGAPVAIPPDDSVANMRVLDRIREVARP